MKRTGFFMKSFQQYGVLILILIASVIFANAVAPGATSLTNLSSMSTFAVEIGLVSFGQAIVILAGGGGIDLSVGAIWAVAEVVSGVLIAHGCNMWVAILLTLLSGVIMGGINGVLITWFRVPAIIATLATMYAYGSIALLLSNGIDISQFPAKYGIFGQGIVFGLPFQLVVIYLPIAILLWYVIGHTTYGSRVFLTGTNEVAARLSGINVSNVRLLAYTITGLLAGVAAIIESSRLITAQPDAGSIANLESITIAVLGGTSIFGGRGSIVGTILATVVITLIGYSFSLANINSVIETGVIGGILILVMILQKYSDKWVSAKAKKAA